jgi:hypothetical protein
VAPRKFFELMTMCLAILLFILGCNPNPVAQSGLPINHFRTTKGAFTKLEFDYPKNWGSVAESKINRKLITIANPDYANSMENLIHGIIVIDIMTVTSGTVNQEIDYRINSIKKVPRNTLKEERIFNISGYQSHKLIIEYKPDYFSTNNLGIAEHIFIPTNDSTYYWFSLQIPENERNGGFGQGFDKVISSVVIKSP